LLEFLDPALLDTCVISSSADASDHLLTGVLVRSRIRHEYSNRNSPSVGQWDKAYIVRCVRHAIVYLGGARLVSDADSGWQIAFQTLLSEGPVSSSL
jgi:hypothetical protein